MKAVVKSIQNKLQSFSVKDKLPVPPSSDSSSSDSLDKSNSSTTSNYGNGQILLRDLDFDKVADLNFLINANLNLNTQPLSTAIKPTWKDFQDDELYDVCKVSYLQSGMDYDVRKLIVNCYEISDIELNNLSEKNEGLLSRKDYNYFWKSCPNPSTSLKSLDDYLAQKIPGLRNFKLKTRFDSRVISQPREWKDTVRNEMHQKFDLIERAVVEVDECFESWCRKSDDETPLLAPYFSMVQSSGVGKTRLMYELGEFAYVIYICLRDSSSNGTPPRTAIVAERLLAPRANFEEFLICCICLLSEKLESGYTPLMWRNYQSIGEKGESEFSKDLSRMIREKSPNLSKACEQLQDIVDGSQEWQSKLNDHIESIQNLKNHSLYGRLVTPSGVSKIKLKAAKSSVLPRFRTVFVIDEARCLIDRNNPRSDAFHMFRRALKELPHSNPQIVTVFTDTNSAITDFSASRRIDSSLRPDDLTSKKRFDLFRPFWAVSSWQKLTIGRSELLFQRFKNCLLSKGSDAEKILFQRDLFQIGRFLWQESFYTLKEPSSVVEFAMQKLMCHSGIPREEYYNLVDKHMIHLAILDCLVLLSVCPISSISSNLIASHMSICAGVTDDRECCYSFYPPEPVLAAAAVEYLRLDAVANNSLETIMGYLRGGLIDTGERGELLMRLSVSFAWVSLLNAQMKTAYFPVKLGDFLPHFIKGFSTEMEAVANQIGKGQMSPETLQELMNGYVFPLQWHRPKKLNMSQEELKRNWSSGRLLLAPNNHQGIDGVIILYLKERDKFTFILDQSKNEMDADTCMKFARNTMNPKLLGLVDEDFDLPYMILYREWRDLLRKSPQKSCVTNLREFSLSPPKDSKIDGNNDIPELKNSQKPSNIDEADLEKRDASVLRAARKVEQLKTTVLLDVSADSQQLALGLVGCTDETYGFFDSLKLDKLALSRMRIASKDPLYNINRLNISSTVKQFQIDMIEQTLF